MKIIQSFWSGNQNNIKEDYGWYSSRYHWMSWILSCQQLVKYYDKVELYTDNFGYEVLINKLKLPYTKVHVILNELDIYPKDLWAIAKIKTYSLQEEPFIHVDGDVFIWNKFPENFINSKLLAQNLESTTGYYREMWDEISKNLTYIPEELFSFQKGTSNLCCNMGIIGGSDIDFFKEYCTKSFEFVNRNIEFWDKINLFNFNIFFEQELFYELSSVNHKKINYLFDEIWSDNAYLGFGDFHMVPHKRTYLHLLGFFKRQSSVCKNMEIYSMKYYPESYSKLSNLLNKTNDNNCEMEFLTSYKVTQLLKEFENELKINQFNDQNFLLKRDLYNQGFTTQFDFFLKNKIDFMIVLIGGFVTHNILTENNDKVLVLEIEEFNCVPTLYELDNVDECILTELRNPTEYFKFLQKMKIYFEEEDEQSKFDYLTLLNGRLMNYIVLKIISIYN